MVLTKSAFAVFVDGRLFLPFIGNVSHHRLAQSMRVLAIPYLQVLGRVSLRMICALKNLFVSFATETKIMFGHIIHLVPLVERFTVDKPRINGINPTPDSHGRKDMSKNKNQPRLEDCIEVAAYKSSTKICRVAHVSFVPHRIDRPPSTQ